MPSLELAFYAWYTLYGVIAVVCGVQFWRNTPAAGALPRALDRFEKRPWQIVGVAAVKDRSKAFPFGDRFYFRKEFLFA